MRKILTSLFLKARTLVLAALSLLPSLGYSQDFPLDDYLDRYHFIHPEYNHLENDSLTLNFFYNALLSLQTDSNRKVNIVHIGDSHIQADYFSGMMRRSLQKEFGNGGRGLLFSYKLARTNGPYNYITGSNQLGWTGTRMLMSKECGISGFRLQYPYPGAVAIGFQLKPEESLEYPTQYLRVFAKANDSLQISVGVGQQQHAWTSYEPGFDLELPVISDNFDLWFKTRTTAPGTDFYGVAAYGPNPGVVYHTIGVNGAEYRHYNQNPAFFEQLQSLSADLVILSMGTNEAYNSRNFNPVDIRSQVDSMIQQIRRVSPNASILVTGTPDHLRYYRKRGYKTSTYVPLVNQVLKEAAIANGAAFWDFYLVMGGAGSMARWHAAGLSDARRIHFRPLSYQIQGALLYRALLEKYPQKKRRNQP